MEDALLEVKDLKVYFPIKGGIFSTTRGHVRAVDGVSFTLKEGETLGLVGESGCGKTTLARAILKLIEPTSGRVIFHGKDVLVLNKKDLRALRRDMQMIFQDPYSSLNPRMTIGNIVGEPLTIHKIARGRERRDMVVKLLRLVGLDEEHMNRYPHEFSGGQRQRVGVARAMALNPKLVVGDEPVSALDVSIQAQVINLLEDLQEKFELSYIIISHDLRVIQHISDRVAVMYMGKIVELADSRELYSNPLHPYTKILLSAVPVPDPDRKRVRIILPGDTPSPVNPPSGCNFHPRCPKKFDRCPTDEPILREEAPGHFVACHLREGSAG